MRAFRTLLTYSFLVVASMASAQTDELNLQKYWKFRHDFVEKFVKIGDQSGESLPAGIRAPLDCLNNATVNGGVSFGTMYWGDGTIRQGHYLELLATEYALKKKYGMDTQGTLNELYYALFAIERIDAKAEASLDDIYGISGFYLNPTLNGFYLREDIPEDFCLNWETDELEARCTNSAFYENNNIAKIHNPGNGYVTKPTTSYQNVPSIDQMSSVLLGLAMVEKLVDDIDVQPTTSDEVKNLRNWSKIIANDMVNYCSNRNWLIIDVNGWPVTNGGGDLFLTAYPVMRAVSQMFDINILPFNTLVNRRVHRTSKYQHCITGFGIDGGPDLQQDACDELFPLLGLEEEYYLALESGVPAGLANNQDFSTFQTWINGGLIDFSVVDPAIVNFWEGLLANDVAALYADWEQDNDIDALPHPFDDIEFEFGGNYQVTMHILFRLGVAAGLWDSQQVRQWANTTGNYALELTNAVLNDQDPATLQSQYKLFLDVMDPEGAFLLKQGYPAGGVESLEQTDGWNREFRWLSSIENSEGGGREGIFSALDYMIFHNLYYLLYDDQLPEFEEKFDCMCTPDIVVQPTSLNQNHIDRIDFLNQKLDKVPTCVQNVFDPVTNVVGGSFTINPFFPDYADLNISTVKFQTENASITEGGTAIVNSTLVVCNSKTLLIQDGGELKANKDDVFTNPQATIDSYGRIRIKSGNTVHIGPNSTLKLRNGSQVFIEDGGKLIIEGTLEYFNGASIITDGEDAEFILQGTLKMMDGGVFSLDHSNSPESGRFIVDGPNVTINTAISVPYCEVNLFGKNDQDEFLVIKDNTILKIGHIFSTNIDALVIHTCKVVLGENSKIDTRQHFNTYNATYTSEFKNEGIRVAAYNKFSSCDFENVNIRADLSFPTSQKLIMVSCNMNNEVGVNDFAEAMVRVDGKGLLINNCNFHGANDYQILATNMLFPSQISLSNFTLPAQNPHTNFGVFDVSNTELKLISNTFDGFYNAVAKNEGILKLKCNTFNNSIFMDVASLSGCVLSATTDDYGGYNRFNSNATAFSNIYIYDANLNLKNGRNFFNRVNPYHITGRLNYPCAQLTSCGIDAARNQWKNGPELPSASKFILRSSDNIPVDIFTTPAEVMPACGFYDNAPQGPAPGIVQGNGNGNSGNAPVGSPQAGLGNNSNGNGSILPFVNTSAGIIRLDHAVANGRYKMKTNNPSGNDEEALIAFDEIFNNQVPKNSRLVKEWLNGSLADMKTSLENVIYEQSINGQIGQSGVDFYVNRYLEALNYMTDSLITDSNYVESFYLELDKAHLYRILGMPNDGFEILNRTETCGLNENEQKVLNYWKKEYKRDILIAQMGMSILDTNILIDTSMFTIPVPNNLDRYYFGTKFTDLNTRHYPDCNSGSGARTMSTSEKAPSIIEVYPNPAEQVLNFEIVASENVVVTEIIIYTTDGKETARISLTDSQRSVYNYPIDDWATGAYFYDVITPSGVLNGGTFFVK